MKSTNFFKVLAVNFLAIILFFSSCKKAEEIIESVSEEEAVEVVENSLSSDAGGLAGQIEESAAIVSAYTESKNEYCGLSFDSAINIVNPSEAVITYHYNLEWDWVINCNQFQIPESFVFNCEMGGGYDAPRMSANDEASVSFELSDLDLSTGFITFNGSFEREGTCQSKIGEKRSFSSKIIFEAMDVKVDKATKKLLSGTANLTLEAKTSEGKTFSFDGVVTFTGGDTATVKFENEYEIQL